MTSKWFVYMVCCADSTLYTGITTDPERRLKEHNSGEKGARYTKMRRPVSLAYLEEVETRAAAARRECAIKKMNLLEKKALTEFRQP